MKKNQNRMVLALAGAGLLSLALGGCGGGGSDSGTTSSVTTVDMKVSPALGKYRNRTGSPVVITLKDKNGATIKTGTWDDANGNGTFAGIDDSLSSLIIEVSGGEYFDEAAGTYRANARTQRAVVDKPYGAVAVTPLTHAAAKRLIDDSTGTAKIKTTVTSTHIVTENLKEGKRFGVTNPLVPPVLVGETERIAATDNLEAQRYAAILAGMAQAANNAGNTPDEMAEHLASDLADDKLDGQEGTTLISGLAYATADVTTNFATLINTVIQTNGLTADAGTLASLQSTVTAEVAPPAELSTEQVAEVTSSVTAITTATDSFAQARLLFSGLRSGVTPYVNPQGTGYTQTALQAVETDFDSLTRATVGLDLHVRALGDASGWLLRRLSGDTTPIPFPTDSYADIMCIDDQASVVQGLYPVGTTQAIGCGIVGKKMVVDADNFDMVVYFAYTTEPVMTQGSPISDKTVALNWLGRIDRYTRVGGTDSFVLSQKGIGDNSTTGFKNRRKGSLTVTATLSKSLASTTSTFNGSIELSAIKGDLWPVLNNTAASTTDKTTVDLAAMATYSQTKSLATGEVTTQSGIGNLSGTIEAYAGSTPTKLATLTLAPADGQTSIVSYDESALSNASGGVKVTFATPLHEISGQISAAGLTNTSTSTDSELLPNALTFSGTVKDLATSTTIFEGSFTGSADYGNWNPSQSESSTNYVSGTATLIGKLKKSSADPGLSLTAVFTKNAGGAAGNAWQLTYKDANALTVSASFKESDGSGTISNSANSIVVTWYRNDAAKDGDVRAGTTVLGKIVRGVVTYVDGSTESLI